MAERRIGLASVAAIAGVVAASTCCLPVGTLLMSVGLGGASRLLPHLQPYLMALSVLLLGVGFYRTYSGRACTIRRGRLPVVMLWTASALVFLLVVFPQLFASVLADLLPSELSR